MAKKTHPGADVAIACLEEDRDDGETRASVKCEQRRCKLFGEILEAKSSAGRSWKRTVSEFGPLDIPVNTAEQLERTFKPNISG